MSFIAIDLGTSFIKVAVIDLDTYSLQRIQRVPFPDPIAGLDPFKCEFDPAQILTAVNKLLLGMSDLYDQLEGVVMCTQMSCLVMMDQRGKVCSNCIGWRDQRALQPHYSGGGSYYEVLQTRISEPQRKQLGNELPPGAPVCFLFWMAEQNQLSPGLIPVSLADFVLSVLCESTPSVDSTNAMAYELLNLNTLQWHDEVIRELHLNQLQWPAIVSHGEVIGTLRLGGKRVPCYTATGDYQCALTGALIGDRELSINISTGSQVSRVVDSFQPGHYQTRPFFDGKFTNTISHLPAGRSLNILVELVTELAQSQGSSPADAWDYIIKAAERSSCSDLRVNLGFFPGPAGEQGGITNIRERNLDVGSLFLAAFESMAGNYFTCADRIWPDRSWHNIVFSGGLARRVKVLRTIIQERLHTQYRLCPMEEDTLVGLMALALAWSKRAGSVEQAMSQLRLHYSSSQDKTLQ